MDASINNDAYETTPQIESILTALAQLGCDTLDGEADVNFDRVEQLVRSLSSNGWERHREGREPLSVLLKDRMKDQCQETGLHRGAAMDGIVAKIQKAYDDASRYQASTPAMQENPDRNTSSPRTTLNSN